MIFAKTEHGFSLRQNLLEMIGSSGQRYRKGAEKSSKTCKCKTLDGVTTQTKKAGTRCQAPASCMKFKSREAAGFYEIDYSFTDKPTP
jgi:hypothetical protein